MRLTALALVAALAACAAPRTPPRDEVRAAVYAVVFGCRQALDGCEKRAIATAAAGDGPQADRMAAACVERAKQAHDATGQAIAALDRWDPSSARVVFCAMPEVVRFYDAMDRMLVGGDDVADGASRARWLAGMCR